MVVSFVYNSTLVAAPSTYPVACLVNPTVGSGSGVVTSSFEQDVNMEVVKKEADNNIASNFFII